QREREARNESLRTVREDDLALAGGQVEGEEPGVGPRRSFRGAPSRIEILVHDQPRRRGERSPESQLARRPADETRLARAGRVDALLRHVPEPEGARDRPIESAIADRRSDPALRKKRQLAVVCPRVEMEGWARRRERDRRS